LPILSKEKDNDFEEEQLELKFGRGYINDKKVLV